MFADNETTMRFLRYSNLVCVAVTVVILVRVALGQAYSGEQFTTLRVQQLLAQQKLEAIASDMDRLKSAQLEMRTKLIEQALDDIKENSKALRNLGYGNISALIGIGASQVALHRRRRKREEENDAS